MSLNLKIKGLMITITGRWVFQLSMFVTVKVILSLASEIGMGKYAGDG